MSKLLYGSMCLSDLSEQFKAGHPAFSKSEKNGKIYVNVTVWVNDEADQYGNHAALQLSKPKDSDMKPIYFGNLKMHQQQANVGIQQSAPSAPTSVADDDDLLPF
jgi:hypothetical protein